MHPELQHFHDRMEEIGSNIPRHMLDGVKNYVLYGVPLGDFLYALMCNDFMEMCQKADDINRTLFWEYAMLLYNAVPTNCRGNKEMVFQWSEQGGLKGYIEMVEARGNTVEREEGET